MSLRDLGDVDSAADDCAAHLFSGGMLLGDAPSLAPRPSPPERRGGADLLQLIWPHVPGLRKYLQRRIPSFDVDDVVHDILLRIMRRSDGSVIEHPKRYLFEVAKAALVDRYRRENARRAARHCELSEAVHPVDELSPLRILLAREEIRAAETILRRLPKRTQEIIIAVRIEGWSCKRLAVRYKISASAVEKHITRALKALSLARRPELAADGQSGRLA